MISLALQPAGHCKLDVSKPSGEAAVAQVLLVDDDPAVQQTLQAMLEVGGHAVTAAGMGETLQDDLRTAAYELVVTDLHMPGFDGWAVARWVAEHRPGTPVIAMGGDVGGQDPEAMRLFAASLSKPFNRKALLEAVARVLGD
jgi:CheY-like chemotaxis protein